MQKDPLVTFYLLLLTNMSDQTNAVQVSIGTKNHFVNIFIMYLSILFLNFVVVMNKLNNYISSHPNPPLYFKRGVQSGVTFTFIWRK